MRKGACPVTTTIAKNAGKTPSQTRAGTGIEMGIRKTALLVSALAIPTLAGCLEVLGFKDPLLDECAPASCGGGGAGGTPTTDTGGTGGTATTATGGAGGGTAGGAPFGCFPVGTEFDILSESDIPGAASTSEFFVIADPTSTPPKAHVVTRLDLATGTLVARTVNGFDDVSEMIQWSPPAGGSRYVDGYATANEVVVLGHITGATGPTAAEAHLPKNADGEVHPGAAVEAVELPRPFDCNAPGAFIDRVFFSRALGKTSYASTWDECIAGNRRLYLRIEGEPQLVREGAQTDPSLALASYARVGSSHVLGFFDGKASGYSFGSSVGDLDGYQPVSLGASGSTGTAPAGLLAVSPSALGAYWTVFTTGGIVPVQILGNTVSSDKLTSIDDAGSYSTLIKYSNLADVTIWGRSSVGTGSIVVGGTDLDNSAVRFSVISTSGDPLVLDRSVASGASDSIGNVAVAHFGPDGVLVAWQSFAGSVLTVRGRIFDCR